MGKVACFTCALLPDNAEHVDVCIVSGEVDEDCSGSSVQP